MSTRVSKQLLALPFVLLSVLCTAALSHAGGTGDYTPAQAMRGQSVYTSRCEQCHGANLEGQAGPALIGRSFTHPLKSGEMNAAQLFEIIKTQMPKDAPGTLKSGDYLDVLAFILSRNGYPTGDDELTSGNLRELDLEASSSAAPSPSVAGVTSGTASAPFVHHTFGTTPTIVMVATSDAGMQNADGDAKNWLLHGRTYSNEQYSPLTQINATNVSALVPVALTQTGVTAAFEATPIVVNGIMYVSTPTVGHHMKIVAVNAATGARIWEAEYGLDSYKDCCGPVNRGVAVGYGMVYVATLDDRLIAFDATDGRELWQTNVADPDAGYSETMAPQIYDGLVIIGSAGGEWPLRGFVAAYDARLGKQVWRWNTTDPSSYKGDSWKTGGATVWTTPAIDVRRGLVIFSTSNPNPNLYGGDRTGDNLYSVSIVALDAKTGTLRWYYQEVKHDLWDYDATSNVVLFDAADRNGKSVPAAGEAGKSGWFYIVDRTDGHLIRRSEPFVTHLNTFAMPDKQGAVIMPGANGGSEWSAPAYSPKTHMVYVLGINQLMKFTMKPPVTIPGQFRFGSMFSTVDQTLVRNRNGSVSAIDVNTGKIAWQYKTPQPMIGGALATGGNLVFTGEGDGWFDALDARTGKRLWRFQLGAGVNAPPISYEVGNEQYIAVAAGGNSELNYPRGDVIAIFTLPRSANAQESPKMTGTNGRSHRAMSKVHTGTYQ